MSIVDLIQNMPDYIGSNGRDDDEIVEAEQMLGVKFADDYRLYLKEIGLACFDGRELTGICNSKRLNVVEVTIEERGKNPQISYELYVIEQANIDGIVIWQSKSGEVYQTTPSGNIMKIGNSLCEYLN